MRYKSGHSFIQWLRFIGLLLSVLCLGMNALRAQVEIRVLTEPFDRTAVCGFDTRGDIIIYAYDVHDTCIWEASSDLIKLGPLKTSYDNRYGDTIIFRFDKERESELKGKMTVTVKVGKETTAPSGKLEMTLIPKASNVQDVLWDAPVCEGVPMKLSVPADPNWTTGYAPGKLHLNWEFLQAGDDPGDGHMPADVEIKSPSDFECSYDFPNPNYKGGAVSATFFTCERRDLRGQAKKKDLTPFIVKGLYTTEKIYPMKRKDAAEMGEAKDVWKADGSENAPNTVICRDYPGKKGLYITGQIGSVYLGFGDLGEFEEMLNADDKTVYPEYYYSYEWVFDPAEFAFDEERINVSGVGFGKGGLGKNRTVLKVLGGKEGATTNVHKVQLIVTCPVCIERGGLAPEFTYKTTLELHRQDSISNFKDEKHPIDYSVTMDKDEVCAGDPVTLMVKMDEASDYNYEFYSNAKHFVLNPTKPDGSSAEWEEAPSAEKGVYKFTTKKTSEEPGKAGDTIKVHIYPANDCFDNGKTIGKNGQLYKVFVKNPPVMPVLIDPITKKEYEPLYTEYRWLQLGNGNEQEMSWRVFACNYIKGQGTDWVNANQRYGLQVKNDKLFNPDAGNKAPAFGLVDYDGVFLAQDSKPGKMVADFEERTMDDPSVKPDSSWVSLRIDPDVRKYFETMTEVKVGFFAYNQCGRGDTGIFHIKIIDTLTAKNIRSINRPDDWDTLCEGMPLDLNSDSFDAYFTPEDVSDPTERPFVVTDRVDYAWEVPAGWTLNEGGTLADKILSLKVGWGSGPVRLRIGNRCGYGQYLDSNVFVHPFVRVTVVGDSTPCQGDSVVYKFKKADLAEAYQWSFPHDWEIESQEPIDGFANIAVSDQASADAQDSISIGVRVGATAGDVYVVGQKTNVPGLNPINDVEKDYGCNFRFDNYKDHRRDSLSIRVKQWTSRPVIDGDFPTSTAVTSAPDPLAKPDTLCADELYRFQVKKGSEADDSVFFRWFFPDDWTVTDLSKNSDTVDFETPLTAPAKKRMTIRVASSRYDCDATNRGDTAYIAVWLTDTVAVESKFYDAHLEGNKKTVNPTPCEGDTVHYTLNKGFYKEAYHAVFDVRPIEATGDEAEDWASLAASDWEILSEAPYHDTIKMVVGRDPMRLRAAMVSYCDTSSFKEDTIRPISKVIEPGLIEIVGREDDVCEYEAVSFTFDPVEHATDYVFHYPWGDKTDTVRVKDSLADREAGRLTDDGFYKISFADTFAYDKGVVYLEAYNVCGVRPDNDELEITSVLRAPAVPVLAQVDFADFVYDAAHVIGQDTVLDSLCRRVPVVLEAEPNDVAETAREGWRFHYAWSLTAEDASVTAFKQYEAADWASGAGINASDSLWTLTKDADGLKVNYLWLTSRHETCERFGDTLTVALRATDTTALQGEDRIWNYLYDKEADAENGQPKHIQTKPCANKVNEVAYYLDLSALDATGQSYYFRWRRDSTEAFGNVYDPVTGRIAGGKFELNNAPADGDWTTLDTLKMTLPSAEDTLEIQVVVRNRCNEAHLPGLTIATADAIAPDAVYAVVPVSPYICDEEKLTYKVVTLTTDGTKTDTTDGVAKAGQYIWYAPWREKSDTTDVFTMTFEAAAFKPGPVYVVPNNGCGDGHRSDSITITEADILQPPLRVQPVPSPDFASGYDPAAGAVELVADSLCLRSDFGMAVKAELAPGADGSDPDAPQDRLSYGWSTAYGKAEALTIPDAADSTQAVVHVPDFADSAYILYVAARRSVCQRFGDSLRIELFPMDTIRFINDPVEDDEPFNHFTVLTRDALQDGWPTAAVDEVSLSPCVGSTHTYGIKLDFHWSLTTTDAGTPGTAAGKSGRRAKRASKAAIDENRLHFSWNGGQTGATDGRLDGTTSWKSLQPDQLPYVLDVEVGAAGDPLHVSVHAKNICGSSVSKPLTIEPQTLIDVAEKPVFKPLAPLCEDETISVEVEPVAAATGYVWTASFRGGAKDTTAEPKIAYADYAVADGTITVYGFNACGDGMPSDPLDLKPLLRIPERPTATWFDNLKMSAAGDTVYDTLCVSGANLLCVQAAFEGEAVSETESVFYEWQMLPDYADYAVLTAVSGTLADGPDSIYLSPRGMNAGQDLYLMVAARREDCRRWSDTLYIALHLTDVVSVGDLGRLRWYDPATDDRNPIALKMPLCSGMEVRIGVENENAAPAYRWQFPDETWHFAATQNDPTAAVVRVVVGENPGVIRVSPMTDADNRRCTIEVEENNALTSEPITLAAAFVRREFVTGGANAFDAAPCAGIRLTYEIKPLSPAEVAEGKFKHYRWVFPEGWRVYDAAGALKDTNAVESGAVQCSVLPDTASGKVCVYAVSQCGEDNQNDQISVSPPAEASVQPKDTARIAIVADATVCKDSTLQIELQPLNTWTSGTGYDLEVTYLGSDAAVITPESPLTFDFPNAPDSSLVMVGWYSGDSVRLTFRPRHTAGCNVLPVVYALRADTVPAIEGRILGPERVCMEVEAAFKAEAYVEEGVSVSFRWEVPDEEGWEILQGGDSAEVLIRVGRYEGADELTKTIRCYPRALCGTALPFEYALTVNPPAVFNGTLEAFTHPEHLALTPADRPCIGSDLTFELTHPDAPAQVRYVWETPDGWQRTTTGTAADSVAQAVFTASKAGADTLRVRYLEIGNPLSCGLSQPLGYALFIRDSAPKAHLTRPPYPCNTRSEVEFAVAPDAEVDSTAWTWPAAYDDGKAEVSTAEDSLIKNNTLKLKELTEGAGFTEAFALTVRTVNACGARDTLMEIRPVGEIPALPDGLLHISHYCPGDSAYAYADQLEVYAGTGTAYHWLPDERLTPLEDSVVRENDDISGTEQIAWMRFAGGTATDTAEMRFYAQNDCNATDTALIRTAAHTYAILARPERDTAVYGQSGVGLSVVSTQYGTPADYSYEWQPAARVRLSNPEAPDAPETTFATRELYNRYETFYVTSTERIDATTPFYFGRSACRATDTVMIFVDSTFAMATAATDTACMDDIFAMSARPYGGNAQRYYFDWYRLTADSVYELLADAGHGEIFSMPIDAPLIRLMVVGRDTTLIYAETPEVPENPEEPTEPDVPDEPEPDVPENPENPEEPTVPDVPDVPSGEPLYVFSQVDTQYVEVRAFAVNGRWILPGRDEIQVPFGTKVRLSAEATGGGRQYVYDWSPVEMLERHDSTDAAVATLRLYEDCDAGLAIRDLVTGCSDTLRVRISLSDEIGDIPNAFSPNGDGINDVFMKGTDLVIYDRFGQELFRSVQQEGWDGTFKGATVKPGDYLFVVTIRKNGQEYVKKGTVTVFTK